MPKLLVPHLIVVREQMLVVFVVWVDPILILENRQPHWTRLQCNGLWMFVCHVLLCSFCVYLVGWIQPYVHSCTLLLWVPLVLHYLTHANLETQLQLPSIIQKLPVSFDKIFCTSWFEQLCINLIPIYLYCNYYVLVSTSRSDEKLSSLVSVYWFFGSINDT